MLKNASPSSPLWDVSFFLSWHQCELVPSKWSFTSVELYTQIYFVGIYVNELKKKKKQRNSHHDKPDCADALRDLTPRGWSEVQPSGLGLPSAGCLRRTATSEGSGKGLEVRSDIKCSVPLYARRMPLCWGPARVSQLWICLWRCLWFAPQGKMKRT